MFARSLILKTSALPPVEAFVRKSRLFRPLVSRFIAGDTLEQSIAVAEQLLERGLRVSLDYLGENTANEAEANQAKETYIAMLRRIADVPEVKAYEPTAADGSWRPEPLNISIKLTQCGLDQGTAFCEANLREVVAEAKRLGNFVRVDMEASAYTERTVAMLEEVGRDFDNVGTVLQSYLYRTSDDLTRLLAAGMRIRIVKGAYLEPPSVAYPEKAKVDEIYVQCAKKMLLEGRYPAIATQDEAIIEELNRFASERGIAKKTFEYQMLYGVRRDLQERLLTQGYNVRVYLPFGDSWYPYFTRRLAERPANVRFIVKSLLKG